MKTTVRLISSTFLPMETIYVEWLQSRTDAEVPSVKEVATRRSQSPAFNAEVERTFYDVINMKMSVAEHVDFIFLIENCPIILREQMVRHRIGHKFGERIGADIIPDLAGNSSFWSQTMRITDNSKYATNGRYLVPPYIEEHAEDPVPGTSMRDPETGDRKPMTLEHYYKTQMEWIERSYAKMLAIGVPMEDARAILPQALTHRLTWKCNLSSVMHVLSKRGCWIAQLGIWEPVIHDIVNELCGLFGEGFRRVILPPCFDSAGNYSKCTYDKENRDLVSNKEFPPCSLWLNKEAVGTPNAAKTIVGEKRMPRYERMQGKYSKLWMRNPVTGERILA